MGYYVTALAMLTVAFFMLLLFVRASPSSIASVLRIVGPLIVAVAGLVLIFAGRAVYGLPLLILGGSWLARNRQVGNVYTPEGATSTVRSAWLEMQLDHDSGKLDGTILLGELEGEQLSSLSEEELLKLYPQLQNDSESASLMEAYLDSRLAGWREDMQPGGSSGQGSSPSSGPMTKEEAYQVLGLSPGAGTQEIRSAHRRLMKAVHPDSGGSTFLAARINEAKDTLLK